MIFSSTHVSDRGSGPSTQVRMIKFEEEKDDGSLVGLKLSAPPEYV